MELYYWNHGVGNFGDDLNLWLWDALLPGWRDWDAGTVLVGVGSILNADLPADRRKLVLGSGYAYGTKPDPGSGEWDIRAVRGPLTAAALGLPAEKAMADPAILLPELAEFRSVTRTSERLLVPHWQSLPGLDWERVAARAGLALQSPADEARAVIRRIAGAELVLAESMHAAIVADAFRVPWIPVAFARRFSAVKWRDWGLALGHEVRFHEAIRWFRQAERAQGKLERTLAKIGVPRPDPFALRKGPERFVAPLLERQAAGQLAALAAGEAQLTPDARLAQARERLLAMLEGVRRDYGG